MSLKITHTVIILMSILLTGFFSYFMFASQFSLSIALFFVTKYATCADTSEQLQNAMTGSRSGNY